MIATFFAKWGHVTTIPLVESKIVNSECYCEVCVPKVSQEWHCKFKKRVRRQILWHHDNASAHTAARTLDTLADNDIQLLTHPPSSPDLAPCDFFLFPRMKNEIRGVTFDSPESAVAAYRGCLEGLKLEDWASCFEKWFERMHRCISYNGGYFEQL